MSKRREAEVLGFAIQRQAQFPSPSGRDSLFRAARTYGSFVGREDHHGIHSGLDDADLNHDRKHHHHQSRSSSGNQPLLLAPRDATGLLNRRCVRHCSVGEYQGLGLEGGDSTGHHGLRGDADRTGPHVGRDDLQRGPLPRRVRRCLPWLPLLWSIRQLRSHETRVPLNTTTLLQPPFCVCSVSCRVVRRL